MPLAEVLQNDIALPLAHFVTLKVKCLVSGTKSVFSFIQKRLMGKWQSFITLLVVRIAVFCKLNIRCVALKGLRGS